MLFEKSRAANIIVYLIIISICFTNCKQRISFESFEIAYSSNESGNPEIYLTDIEGKSKLKITNYSDRDGYPAWSLGGKKIAFYAYHGPETWSIYTMDFDGKNGRD